MAPETKIVENIKDFDITFADLCSMSSFSRQKTYILNPKIGKNWKKKLKKKNEKKNWKKKMKKKIEKKIGKKSFSFDTDTEIGPCVWFWYQTWFRLHTTKE